jgi:hypothetical protein
MLRGSAPWLLVLVGCARPLLGPEDATLGESSSTGDLPSTSTSTSETESSTTDDPEPDPTCHASYDPCLPVADDLDCTDVRALGLAPVTVIGDDVYELDADGDGLGCE